MPVVIVPPPFQGPTQGQSRIEVPATTVRGAIEAAEALHPGLGAHVLSADGSIHHYVSIFLNGRRIDQNGLNEPIGENDEIELVAAIAGG